MNVEVLMKDLWALQTEMRQLMGRLTGRPLADRQIAGQRWFEVMLSL